MIQIDKTEVFGWESAIRGMRNPMNSWDKSDSYSITVPEGWRIDYNGNPVDLIPEHTVNCYKRKEEGSFVIGDNDLKLMKNLSKAGPDHGKFLRMINVTCDINAPLYWWKEYDTYKVGTVANSCSTMHKIHAKEFVLEDFSTDQLLDEYPEFDNEEDAIDFDGVVTPLIDLEYDIWKLNLYRKIFLKTKNKVWWWQMIQRLPSSYNQKRTVQLNYQVLKNMYNARKSHKLDEWRNFCAWCETLPYFKEICLGGDNNEK